jgi:hypothetical protein
MLKAAWNAVLNGRGCLLGAFAGRFFWLFSFESRIIFHPEKINI